MCLKPLHIQIKRASVTDGCLTRVAVPCGHCYQCKRKKQNDYYLRAYYQCLHCMNKGGFILFDCLTYSDANLPHLHDFIGGVAFWDKFPYLDYSTFNKRHITLFFKSLRDKLERDGYEVKDNLKYLLSSEYGTDERFTHRPHYHLMIYCNIPFLTSLELSSYIASIWKYGRTDGVTYKGAQYVLEHCSFGKAYNASISEALVCCEYVSKYVTKDSSFEASFNQRVTELSAHFDVAEVKKVCNPFLRVSSGFGMDILSYVKLEDIINDDGVRVPDKKNVVKFYSLPQYYRRKLFFDVVKYDTTEGKKVTYSLNDVGSYYMHKRLCSMIDTFNQFYQDFLHTFKQFVNSNGSLFAIDLLKNMLRVSSSPLFFNRLARYSLLVHGRTFYKYSSDIARLDSTLVDKVVKSYWFERAYICNQDIDGNYYLGELSDLSSIADHMLDTKHPLFDNMAVILSRVVQNGNYDLCTSEFANFDNFLKYYEVANYFMFVNADENYKRKERQKRRYKSIYSLLNI